MMQKNFLFKDPKKMLDIFYIHPALALVLATINYDFYKKGVPFLITSSIRSEAEEKALNAVSSTHKEGRACDLSVTGINRPWLNAYIKEIEHRFSHLAAVKKDLSTNLIELHDNGNGLHLHIQVRP
jgi:uncharacterized protein YcbK (DUF882 family)